VSCARAERRQASSDASEASAAFKQETITRVAGLCIAARPTDVVDDLRVVWARHRVTVRPASRQPHRGLQVTSTAPSPGRASCLSAKLGARLGRLATGKGANGARRAPPPAAPDRLGTFALRRRASWAGLQRRCSLCRTRPAQGPPASRQGTQAAGAARLGARVADELVDGDAHVIQRKPL